MRTYLLSLILLLLQGCTLNHFVLLKSDGTVRIETDLEPTLMTRIENSEIVTDIDTSGFRANFTVTNIDSIGLFVPYIKPGFLRFDNLGDSIMISTGHTNPYDSNQGSCCHLWMRIRSDFEMQANTAKGKEVKYKKNNDYQGYWIGQSIREQKKGKNNIAVTLKKKKH